ncbi:type I-B CRISPR-associated protein Cas8b1/Cst1 [Desulfothermus naphthae]
MFMITGDPFVDAGNAVIEELKRVFKNKSIIDLIDMVSDWFIHNWKGKLDSLQLNSNITNVHKRKRAKQETMDFFNDLHGKGNSSVSFGNCRICGKEEKLFRSGRDIYPLSGSGAFVNYHHCHEEGILICKDCIVKLFFLPLSVLQMGGNLALLHLTNEKTINYWTEKVIKTNLNKLSQGISDGILQSDFKNPKNALFNMATDLIINFNCERETLQLYYFTNYAAKPNCEIYILPSPVFSYLNKVLKSCKKDWYLFFNKHYKINKAEWDDINEVWRDKKNDEIDYKDYKDNKNEIVEKLLNGVNLVPTFRKFYRECFLKHKNVSTLMFDYYLKEVKNMNAEQIQLIKKLGNSIIEIAKKDDNNFKKYLTMIESASKAFQLRAVIISLIKKHYLNGEKEPLITLEEYVNYLFPDGTYWSEIRDILIIYLYELLHKKNIEGINVEEINFTEPEEELTEF